MKKILEGGNMSINIIKENESLEEMVWQLLEMIRLA